MRNLHDPFSILRKPLSNTISLSFIRETRSLLTILNLLILAKFLSKAIIRLSLPNGDILVYDVSRWGRFQDADESAFYEFKCKRAGIKVHYCAEMFQNDGSLISTLSKGVKRIMAGEYIRELSVKVLRGQCNLILRGFKQSGSAGYGLRRALVDEKGNQKGIVLENGQRKSIQSDRVILIKGPEEEVRLVHRIYRMFIDELKKENDIAQILNSEGMRTDLGRMWTCGTARQVLTNEKYIGNSVFNRTSQRVAIQDPLSGKKSSVKNPPEEWVRYENAFEPTPDG